MKNTIKVLGIIAIVAVIGFSMAACGGDDEGDDSSTAGRLIITGLSSYNGWKITAAGTNELDLPLTSQNNYSSSVEIVINDVSVTLYVWKYEKGRLKNYTGNDQNVKFSVTLSKDGNVADGTVTANFANGQASGAFVPDGSQDIFAGTWTTQEGNGMNIVAANGSFTVNMDGRSAFRGTYTVSGNKVSITFTHVNTDMSGKADKWTPYDDLPPETHDDIPPKTIDGTINGNQFIIDTGDNDPMTFTKQ